ncbi:MAG: YdjY domain-containing protein [Pseudomonadales bacterium]
MSRLGGVILLAGVLAFPGLGALAQTSAQTEVPEPAGAGEPAAAPEPIDLGDGRYRIGNIVVDRNTSPFSVAGSVLPVDTEAMPIEFLAVTRGGMKAYEAIIELDTDAVSFNLACILLGLDASKATLPVYHFDPAVLKGDPVQIDVSWVRDGTIQTHGLIDLILVDGKPAPADWVYLGSGFGQNGLYMAEAYGTLIGVVHDPDSIIQHRTGLGLGDYGAVTVNPELMPAAGTPVTITVSAPRS